MTDQPGAANCTGAHDCIAARHIHGCHADYGTCDAPEEHQRGVDALFEASPEELQEMAGRRKRRLARFQIHVGVIADALHLPAWTQIVGASFDVGHNVIWLTVENDDLPESGDVPNLCNPAITHKREEYEWTWNVEAP